MKSNNKKGNKMKVKMTNPHTGEIKEVKVGWSWTLFLFSSFLGLPLFLRKLYVWGGLFLVLWVVFIVTPPLMPTEEDEFTIILLINLIFISLQTWLGIKGNEMTAKNYLENGWKFVQDDQTTINCAKEKWGINI
ncbi:MAG: hypothetical protein CL623_08210 [Arcobacter sp.]|nr:hypothetical protein [Arcobacter sp.]|tara:strand:- start:16792 stop:17193 length:402 start_codon:yes stop_codon:yes gene_type:complete